MQLPLKYLLPLLIFITGVFLVSIQTYIHMGNEYAKMIRHATEQAKVTGNRLASRITFEVKSGGFTKQKMISLTAPYMAETLDQVGIYNNKLHPMFSRFIPSHANDLQEEFESSSAYKVIQDQYSEIVYHEQYHHVSAYFPIDLPVEKGEVLPRNTGVLHLVFDVTQQYLDTRKDILRTAIMNIVTISIMVVFLSFLMYFLVFRRLDALHKATVMLANGDFDVHVPSKGEDELSEVIHTFNSMASDINTYIHQMEEQVNKVVQERSEQGKILIQQSRLASMGEMIGNIAHQWRQPLNALGLIIQKIELFSNRGKLTHDILEENVHKATSIIKSMSTTIDDFRDFFKPNKEMEYFDIRTVVHEVISLQEASLKEAEISLDIDIDQPVCELYGFKNEFAQVLINLINNAKDALIENHVTHGFISISGKNKKDKVIFKLSDNAGGIPAGIIDRIFEPYYTTKEEGKGTGIGLYMSKMIIEENMHGTLQVRNNKIGAEFSMIFKNKRGKL